MMLHGRYDDFIPLFQGAPTKAGGDKIDRLRSAADENNFPSVAGIDEFTDTIPGAFIRSSRFFAERMHATVDIGIVMAIIMIDRLDFAVWFLRRGAVVQVHQRLAADLSRQDGEIPAYGFQVQQLSGLPAGSGFFHYGFAFT